MRFVLSLLAMIAAPVLAQDQNQEPDQALVEADASTPEDDLDCALFLSLILGSGDPEITPDDEIGIASGMAYFSRALRGGSRKQSCCGHGEALSSLCRK